MQASSAMSIPSEGNPKRCEEIAPPLLVAAGVAQSIGN
jgi:hypothetical protein